MAVLSVIAIVLLFILVFTKDKGIIAQLPEYFEEQVTGYYVNWQEETFAKIIGTDRPTIMLIDGTESQLSVGQTYNLPELFLAKDKDGNELVAKVMDVSTSAGESVLYIRDENGLKKSLQDVTAFKFSSAGCYKIAVTATDKNWKNTDQTIEVAVQGVNE
jgi:hypothetical protein